MSTVLVIEDDFLQAYELEYELKSRGYRVEIAATLQSALDRFHSLHAAEALAAVICDNRLLGAAPAAATIYARVRAASETTPFVIYSAFPPDGLPGDDPYLAIVRKPRFDDAVSRIVKLAPGSGRGVRSPATRRHAA